MPYPKKKFTIDGRLVGDLGEALAERGYDLRVFDDMRRHHDAVTPDGKRVQIKATMKESLSFPAGHVPDYYLGIRINPNGSIEEIFNGPGDVAAQAVAARSHPKTNLHALISARRQTPDWSRFLGVGSNFSRERVFSASFPWRWCREKTGERKS